jgi:hypothetical protein
MQFASFITTLAFGGVAFMIEVCRTDELSGYAEFGDDEWLFAATREISVPMGTKIKNPKRLRTRLLGGVGSGRFAASGFA